MSAHWHISIDHFIVTGVMAVVFINLLRIAAAWLITMGGPLESLGTALGGSVTFGESGG
jgi:hypothetical protein